MMKSAWMIVLCSLAAGCGGGGNQGDRPDARPVPDAPVPSDARLVDSGPEPDAPVPDAQPAAGPPAVWFQGDPAENGRFQVGRYVHGDPVPVTAPVMIPAAASIGQTFANLGTGELAPFDVNAAGTRVVFAADIAMTGRWDLYVADADGGNVTRVVAMPEAGRLVDAVRLSPDGARIAFRADYDVAGRADIYVVSTSGADVTPVRVSPDRDPNAVDTTALDAFGFWWTPGSGTVLMAGDFTEATYRELWSVDVTGVDPVRTPIVERANIGANAGAKGVDSPVYPAGGRYVFRGRLDNDNRVKLYIVDADGANLEVLPNSTLERGPGDPADIGPIGVSADGTMLAFAADSVVQTAFEIHVMPIDGSAVPERITSGALPAARNPDPTYPLWWSPDGTRVAFVANYEESKMEPYVAAVGGAQVDVRRLAIIGDAGVLIKRAQELAWLPDGSGLYMVADHITRNDFELYRLDVSLTDQVPELVVDVVTGGDIRGVRITAGPAQ